MRDQRFPRWMARFPTIESLAAADTDTVMAEWDRLSHRLVRWTLEPSADTPPADAVWLLRADWEARAWPRPLRVWWDGLTEASRAAWWGAGL